VSTTKCRTTLNHIATDWTDRMKNEAPQKRDHDIKSVIRNHKFISQHTLFYLIQIIYQLTYGLFHLTPLKHCMPVVFLVAHFSRATCMAIRDNQIVLNNVAFSWNLRKWRRDSEIMNWSAWRYALNLSLSTLSVHVRAKTSSTVMRRLGKIGKYRSIEHHRETLYKSLL